jgi:hypothetical protein
VGNTRSAFFEIGIEILYRSESHNLQSQQEGISNSKSIRLVVVMSAVNIWKTRLTSTASILSLTPVPAHALWERRKSSPFPQFLTEAAKFIPAHSQEFRKFRRTSPQVKYSKLSLMLWKCTRSGTGNGSISCDRPVTLGKKEKRKGW